MADTQILAGGVKAAPLAYLIPNAQQILLKAAYASFDGTSASGPFLPCIRILSAANKVVGEYKADTAIVAGASAEVSFAPFLRRFPQIPGPWHYATPVAPATAPGDFFASDTLNAAFQNGWLNGILPDGTYSPLRWRLLEPGGDCELVGVIDGGTIGSTVVTLPAGLRPLDDAFGVIASADATRLFVVQVIASTGAFSVIATIPVTSGAAGPAGGDLTGTYPNPTIVNVSELTTKGDLLAGAGGSVSTRLPVGTDTFVLTADSTQSLGVKWAAAAGGVTSFAKSGGAAITGAVTISGGGGITLTEAGQNVQIAASGSATPSFDGWIDDTSETWTYASGSGGGVATFTVPTDLTAKYTAGTYVKLTQTTVKFFVVTGSSFGAGTTTVTIFAGTDFTLANAAISVNFHSYEVNPQGWPTWFNYNASPTGWASFTTNQAQFAVHGRMVAIQCFFTGTSNSTSTSSSLPITATALAVNASGLDSVGSDNGVTIQTFAFFSSTTAIQYRKVVGTPASWTASGTKNVNYSAVYAF